MSLTSFSTTWFDSLPVCQLALQLLYDFDRTRVHLVPEPDVDRRQLCDEDQRQDPRDDTLAFGRHLDDLSDGILDQGSGYLETKLDALVLVLIPEEHHHEAGLRDVAELVPTDDLVVIELRDLVPERGGLAVLVQVALEPVRGGRSDPRSSIDHRDPIVDRGRELLRGILVEGALPMASRREIGQNVDRLVHVLLHLRDQTDLDEHGQDRKRQVAERRSRLKSARYLD